MSAAATASKTSPAVEMLGIRRHFPGVQALKGVDFRADPGEIHALMGENGAGKSTLMRILAGAERMDDGQIVLSGEEVEISGPIGALSRGISTVYQETSLASHLSVAENLYLGRWPTKGRGLVDWRKLYLDAAALLERLQINVPTRMPVSRLTIAQQQMTEIAKALSQDVKVLVLDEPTSALAENEVAELFRVLRDLRGQGVAIVYISHAIEEILDLCDWVAVMRDGELVGEREVAQTSADELIRMMVGRDLVEMFPKVSAPVGDELLGVQGLRVRGQQAEVSFSVRAGEVVGFVGLLGAGRTTLMRALIGAIPIDSGTIFRRGEAVKIRDPRAAIRNSIGYLSDDRRRSGLAGVLSVADNLTLASLPQFSRVGVLRKGEEHRAASAMVETLRIMTPSLEQPVSVLSGGNQQKTVLGKWLIAGVEVLVLDEPTRGVDVGAKVEIYRLINALAESGKAIIFVSSYLPEVLGMADRILVMRDHAIVAEFKHGEATQEDIMFAAMGEAPVGAAAAASKPEQGTPVREGPRAGDHDGDRNAGELS
jgi:ABC-type sugar transport system ATPase subunit